MWHGRHQRTADQHPTLISSIGLVGEGLGRSRLHRYEPIDGVAHLALHETLVEPSARALPALWTGLVADDYIHSAMLLGLPGFVAEPLGVFSFLPGADDQEAIG